MSLITDEEFRRNGRDSSDPLAAAVQYAVGAASVCWENEDLLKAGVFDAERAADIADSLVVHLRKSYGLVAKSDLSWLLTLIENAKPSRPGDPRRDWEGAGRDNAKRILTTALEPDARRRRYDQKADRNGLIRGQDRIARNR